MKSWLWVAGVAVVGAVLLVTKKVGATENLKGDSKSIQAALMKATIPGPVMDAAKKWAQKRELSLSDVLATILLESRGNPKAHAKTAKEDSRGAMQVNVNAWGSLLSSLKYKPDDLFDADKGIEVGTYILRKYRDAVKGLVGGSKVGQVHSLDTLTRLYYAGPTYVSNMIRNAKKTEDTAHAFKNSETYVQHWKDAKLVVAQRWGVG
jgi:soluble lytic murein transglycosylase-like protein